MLVVGPVALLITGFLSFIIIGPIALGIGTAITGAIQFIFEHAGWLGAQFMVSSMHHLLLLDYTICS